MPEKHNTGIVGPCRSVFFNLKKEEKEKHKRGWASVFGFFKVQYKSTFWGVHVWTRVWVPRLPCGRVGLSGNEFCFRPDGPTDPWDSRTGDPPTGSQRQPTRTRGGLTLFSRQRDDIFFK